LDYSQHQQLLW